MKTFLHYTKERELDEGVFGALGGALGTATRGLAKVGDFAAGFRDTVAPAFAQGAKPGSTLTGITGAAQAIRGHAEKKREEEFAKTQRFVSAKRRSLGRNHTKVKDFDAQEADILDPQNTTFKNEDAREAALRKHYSEYKWN